MSPTNPNAKKTRATATSSSAECCVTNEGDDRFSSLPHSILGYILTLLSVTEAARMTAVSRTWRDVFKSPDYKFDGINDSELWRGQCRPRHRSVYLDQSAVWRFSTITSLLDARHDSIHRFTIKQTLMKDNVITGWLYTLSQSGIILNCSSLRCLSLSNCRWPRSNVRAFFLPRWTLPLVTELTLSYMDMTPEDIKDLLTRCPALLSLSLGYSDHYGVLEIQFKNLLSLTILGLWQYVVRVVDAPKLERLFCWPFAARTYQRTIPAHTPRLYTIGMLRHCPFEDGVVLEQVRTIAFFSNVDKLEDLYQIIKTLRHVSYLETLHIKMKDGSGCDSSKSKAKLAFTNYLLGETKSLRYMHIYKKRMVDELLPPESRGSRDAEVLFCDSSSQSILELDVSASNIKLADPFMP
ncbi:hypothetical protein QOZ80_7BG0591060 [Eleusine coracana subsp. coracana]|nr:hypothetical protein QOZ80_7BG0591040 [Eleusine coracana subsp. coracana]KAK3124712.1 hypothetical protein QOZ80_7BG0591060 [Eleusine coracana subsp. coracana]